MLEAPGALRPLEGSSLLVGPPLFNALFLTRHAHQHFLVEEGISLRHVCDWAMFLKRYRQEFDWEEFMSICSRYGLSRFVESMTRLAEYVLCSDELEICGWYLNDREQFKEYADRESLINTSPNMGTIFDAYYRVGLGFKNEFDMAFKKHYALPDYPQHFGLKEIS